MSQRTSVVVVPTTDRATSRLIQVLNVIECGSARKSDTANLPNFNPASLLRFSDGRGRYSAIGGGTRTLLATPKLSKKNTLLETLKISFVGAFPLTVMPIVFIGVGIWTGYVIKDVLVRKTLEQIAGGVLVYTWGAKIFKPICDEFKEAMGENPTKTTSWNQISAWITSFFAIQLVLIFASLLYIFTEHAASVQADSSIFFYGVNNITDADSPRAQGPEELRAALTPFYIGFALDGFTLVLIEWDEVKDRVNKEVADRLKNDETDVKNSQSLTLTVWWKNKISFLIAPIALSIDNFLTGAGLYDAVFSAYGSGLGFTVVVFCGCVILGWFLGTVVRFMYDWIKVDEVNDSFWNPLAEFFRCGIIGAAGLSFLDAGLDLIPNGLTFWVGFGAAMGWLIHGAELLFSSDDSPDDKK